MLELCHAAVTARICCLLSPAIQGPGRTLPPCIRDSSLFRDSAGVLISGTHKWILIGEETTRYACSHDYLRTIHITSIISVPLDPPHALITPPCNRQLTESVSYDRLPPLKLLTAGSVQIAKLSTLVRRLPRTRLVGTKVGKASA